MLDLALSQIYKLAFPLWKSVTLDNAWVEDSRLFIYFFSRVFSRVQRCATLSNSMSASQTILTGLFKVASFGPS